MSRLTRSQKQESMFRIIKAWQESQLTQNSFCQEQDLKKSVFHYWLRKYRESDPNDNQQDRFIPIDMSPAKEKHSTYACVLEYPDGTVLRLNTFPGIPDLIRLIQI